MHSVDTVRTRPVDTIGRVPNQPKTAGRNVRIPDDDWNDLGARAAGLGTDRTKVIVAFVRWYLRRPGATLPERPPAGRHDR
jgi:hypothetical protein